MDAIEDCHSVYLIFPDTYYRLNNEFGLHLCFVRGERTWITNQSATPNGSQSSPTRHYYSPQASSVTHCNILFSFLFFREMSQ